MSNEFRIPTIAAFLLVGGLVAVLSIFADDARILFGRAAQPASTIPQSVEQYNKTDSSALIFWTSSDVAASSIKVPSLPATYYDVRDTDEIPKPYKNHIFEIVNLPAEKSSVFEIYNGNQLVYKGTIFTGPVLSKPPQVLPLYGKAPKEIDSGVFITAKINDESSYAFFSSNPSNWALPLASMRTSDLTGYYCEKNACSDNMIIQLTFTTESASIVKKSTLGSSRPYSDEEVLSGSSAIPLISEPLIIAKPNEKPTPKPTKKVMPPTSTPSPTPKKSVLSAHSTEDVVITYPKEGQALTFSRPLIRGTGVAGHEVTITIKGEITQIGKTKITEKNTWQWSPSYPLSGGEQYTLSISTINNSNKKITLTRTFSILKSGESVLSASSPSATLIPFPTATPSQTIDIPTATPTLFITAGPEISLFFIGGGGLLLLLAFAIL